VHNPPLEYDVFISYTRSDTMKTWIKEILINALKDFSEGTLNSGRDISIYLDITRPYGEKWKEEIYNALYLSKCMICICSTDYCHPHKEWCHREIAAMLEKQKLYEETKLILGSEDLIFPLFQCDLQNLPNIYRNYNGHNIWGSYGHPDRMAKSSKEQAYEELRPFVKNVVDRINQISIRKKTITTDISQFFRDEKWQNMTYEKYGHKLILEKNGGYDGVV